jgi:hypothetical protein
MLCKVQREINWIAAPKLVNFKSKCSALIIKCLRPFELLIEILESTMNQSLRWKFPSTKNAHCTIICILWLLRTVNKSFFICPGRILLASMHLLNWFGKKFDEKIATSSWRMICALPILIWCKQSRNIINGILTCAIIHVLEIRLAFAFRSALI